MNDIKNDKLLDKIFSLAKNIGGKPVSFVTPERALTVVLSIIDGSLPFDDMEAFSEIKTLVTGLSVDLKGFKQELLKTINAGVDMDLVNRIYMEKVDTAYKRRLAAGDVRTAYGFISVLVNQPAERIGELLERYRVQPSASDWFDTFSKSGNNLSDTSKPVGNNLSNTSKPVGNNLSDSRKTVGNNEPKTDMDDQSFAPSDKAPADDAINMEKLVNDIKEMRENMAAKVLGQDNAIDITLNGYFQRELQNSMGIKHKRPAIFLYAGPPGVGKTSLAEAFAEEISRVKGSKYQYKRFNMSEYGDKEAPQRFAGSTAVFTNAAPGVVTSFVSKNPQSVLLFDEIEKAHYNVLTLLYQILDEGFLEDGNTLEKVPFKDTYVIFTSNAGKQFYEEYVNGDFSDVATKTIVRALEKDKNPETKEPFFPSALCSRIAQGNVVMFNYMNAHVLTDITKNTFNKNLCGFENTYDIKFDISPLVYPAILYAEGGMGDARTITARSEQFFNNEMHELVRLVSSPLSKTKFSDIKKINVEVELPEDEELKKLFAPDDIPNILVFDTLENCKKYDVDNSIFKIYGFDDPKEAKGCLKKNDIKAILININFGKTNSGEKVLNIEDVHSEARDFFGFVREHYTEIPIYFIETDEHNFAKEEVVSFMRKGVKGVINATCATAEFKEEMKKFCARILQQDCMNKLARQNKVVSYETAQTVSDDGSVATLRLFDFKTTTAVDPEDADNILSAFSKPDVTFGQVIGADTAQKELKFYVDYLKHPRKYIGTALSKAKGILLYGPPGTGKTMLAKAMANASDTTFISIEGNKLMGSPGKAGSEKVHQLFRTARKYAPTIIFIDEIDTIGRERGTGNAQEDALTALLTEMDGFKADNNRPVFVLAATNYNIEEGTNKSLDSALLRRFDKHIYIGLPGYLDRKRFLEVRTSDKNSFDISADAIESIARRSSGLSPANLESVLQSALRVVLMRGDKLVTDKDFNDSFEAFNFGEEKTFDETHLLQTARHEAGHAFMCWYSGKTPSYLTIVSRGNHGGYMMHNEDENKGVYTKEELLWKIRTSLSGRAAEVTYYGAGGLTTGASSDLDHASHIARLIIGNFGMDEDYGLISIGAKADDECLADVRKRANALLKEQFQIVLEIINQNKDAIDKLVNRLIEKFDMDDTEIEAVLKGVSRPE